SDPLEGAPRQHPPRNPGRSRSSARGEEPLARGLDRGTGRAETGALLRGEHRAVRRVMRRLRAIGEERRDFRHLRPDRAQVLWGLIRMSTDSGPWPVWVRETL